MKASLKLITGFSLGAICVIVAWVLAKDLFGERSSKAPVPPPSITPVLSTPTPSPSPTPKPLTFSQRNELYGPCIYAPTLMYHHVEDLTQAGKEGHAGLSVAPEMFHSQMQYLHEKGYTPAGMSELLSFFDSGGGLGKKPVLLTFDDGYNDFYLNAYPVLKEFGFKATLFLPTGLVENPGYLSWKQVSEISGSGLVLFANHTWSHHNVAYSKDVVQKEILTADTQLTEHGVNFTKVFAYPYGLPSHGAEDYLTQLGYGAAFTTTHGSALCKKQRLILPRIRIGNSSLSAYGL